MVEDPKWELAILATVQGFYEKLLQGSVRGEVPVPAGLEAASLQQGEGNLSEILALMHRWLRVLDMAITPAMLRRALTPETDAEIAEAMLRYFTRKRDSSDANRDKTDLVTTFLYRHPRVPGQWERRGYGLDGSLPLSPFEIALIEILADSDVPSLSEEHTQLLRQFDRIRAEAESFRDLNALLDSGIIARVRDMKQALDSSFYHPGALATIAPYNAAFGTRFDQLFRTAAAEIRSFAEALTEQGGTILGNVDGVDVTVEHVAALHEGELLKIDYGTALEKFRRVSKLKKTLESRPPIRRKAQSPGPAASPTSGRAEHGKVNARAYQPPVDLEALLAAVTPQQISTEESKLLRIEESIRVFVRVADPKFRQVVPMRFFNLTLTAAEADAYCASHLEEKSLRADVSRALLRMVAVAARMSTELEELKRAEGSASLRRLHSDSLVVLLGISRSVIENARRVMAQAAQEGSPDQESAIRESLQKLSARSEVATKAIGGTVDVKRAGAGGAQ